MTTPLNRLAFLAGYPQFSFPNTDEVREAIALLVVAMAVEDGEFDDQEHAAIHYVLSDNPVFNGDLSEIHRCTHLAFLRVQDTPSYPQHLQQALSHFNDTASRELVAAMLLSIVAADGVESPYEADFVAAIMQHLDISQATAQHLMLTAAFPFLQAHRKA